MAVAHGGRRDQCVSQSAQTSDELVERKEAKERIKINIETPEKERLSRRCLA